jgi:hypothetical protein
MRSSQGWNDKSQTVLRLKSQWYSSVFSKSSKHTAKNYYVNFLNLFLFSSIHFKSPDFSPSVLQWTSRFYSWVFSSVLSVVRVSLFFNVTFCFCFHLHYFYVFVILQLPCTYFDSSVLLFETKNNIFDFKITSK